MKAKLVLNQCGKCKFEWKDYPGGFAQFRECPRCKSKYWVAHKGN